MNPLYMASIAGLAVGLFHNPGPTLAAQYPERWCVDDPAWSAAMRRINRQLYCDAWKGVIADEEYVLGSGVPMKPVKNVEPLANQPDDFDVYYIPETGAICTLRFVRETMVKMGRSPDFEIPANWERQ